MYDLQFKKKEGEKQSMELMLFLFITKQYKSPFCSKSQFMKKSEKSFF